MSFFQKVKQFLGIVGVKVEMQVDDTFSKTGSVIQGKVIITSKSDQQILAVKVSFEETWKIGKGESETVKNFDLGEWMSEQEFSIKAGQTKEFPFTMNYSMIKSENDRMAESSSVGKALGGIGKMLDGEQSVFKLIAMADVKGAAFDPNCVKVMKPVA